MSEFDLSRQIRVERAHRRARRPFRATLFTRINALVKAHALGERFLEGLAGPREAFSTQNIGLPLTRPKPAFEPPLYSLSGEEEYRTTMAILTRVNNPYLNFVNSPDEIFACQWLFELNPSIGPDSLRRFHLAALLRAELAKRELRDLMKRVGTGPGKGEVPTTDSPGGESLQERIRELRDLIRLVGDEGAPAGVEDDRR
jgi:hypothetical protein